MAPSKVPDYSGTGTWKGESNQKIIGGYIAGIWGGTLTNAVLGMQSISPAPGLFELFHFACLLHHRHQQAAHQLHHSLVDKDYITSDASLSLSLPSLPAPGCKPSPYPPHFQPLYDTQ